MAQDEMLQKKVWDWGYACDEIIKYEYTVYCERDDGEGFINEFDESFDTLDEALNFQYEMIAEGWTIRYIKRYDNEDDYEGIEIKV